MTLALPTSVERGTVPDWFKKGLAQIDSALIVYFNPIRQRWIVDRCIRPDNTLHTHDGSCPRTNVKVVQDSGRYMPLCEQVLDWFRANDVGTKFVSADAFVKDLTNNEQECSAKLKEERRQNTINARKDNRRQIAQFKTLIDRHDVARPHK